MRKHRPVQLRVRGTLHDSDSWRLPLTPTLSPQAGRGGALPWAVEFDQISLCTDASRNLRSFRRLAFRTGQHALKPATDDGFGLAHNARDELGAGRDVVDESLNRRGRPD